MIETASARLLRDGVGEIGWLETALRESSNQVCLSVLSSLLNTPGLQVPDDERRESERYSEESADLLAQQQLSCVIDAAVLPTASALLILARTELQLGRGVDAARALPVYLDGTGPWRKRVE